MANDIGGLFGGLKRLLFKDDFVEVPPKEPTTPAAIPTGGGDSTAFGTNTPNEPMGETDSSMKAKAYQLLESINQPGVDFLEVWNASEEAGGINSQTVKTTFNALKYADKTLTKAKLLSTGEYYCAQLQKAIENDLQKKAAQREQLNQQKATERRDLADSITTVEKQISTLQQSLREKQAQLAALDATYEPRLRELDEKMTTGKATIDAMIKQMQSLIAIAQSEL
jgi:hypothetical protein